MVWLCSCAWPIDAHHNLDSGKGNGRESRTVSRAHRKLIFSWPSVRWGWGAARCKPGRWGRAAWGPRPPARSHSASADVRLRALKHALLSYCVNFINFRWQRSVEFLGEKNILLFLLKDKANKANKVFLLAFYCNFALIDINIGPNEWVWHYVTGAICES